MHRITIALAVLLGLSLHATAQKSNYTIDRDDFSSLQVSFNVGNITIGKTVIDGQTFSTLSIDGYQQLLDAYGTPDLPTFSSLIEVPVGAEFDVTVSDAKYDTLKPLEYLLAPVQLPRRKSDTTAQKLWINREVYSLDAFVGQRTALVEAVGIARDRRLARLQFSPVRYNPVSGQVIVCRKATVTVKYRNADREATLEMFERYHSPAFNIGSQVMNDLYPKAVRTAAPVRYLIVAHSMFRGQLDTFVDWKRRKGFITDIVYTDDPNVGTTTTSIQAYLQLQYSDANNASPAPTYLLLVGDVAQIPAFNGNTTNSHITDLYYSTWTTGDVIPDCYCGRFSAQNLSQLTPQIEKTLMYEQYTFADPTFLDRAVMVAGVDGGTAGDHGYTHADPAMDYAITNYINGSHGWSQVMYFKNDVSIVPTGTNVTVGSSASSNSATVRSYYNQGAGWINYSAHGGSTGWGTPSFGNTHVAQMTNNQKFGLLIGNCCQTNMYGENTCFGEALLRKDNYCGAVGYIGGSDYTYWGEDFYWAVGLRSGISATMSMAYNASNLGAYDRLCHTHGEAYSQWMTSQGAIMMAGNMAVQSSTSSLRSYYWEIYHLMGDPSVMTYLTQANVMTLVATPTILSGTTSYSVTAAPYAYVALTDTATHTLVAATFANATGQATLTLPTGLTVGGYELAASAQQYRTAFQAVSVIPPAGAYAIASSLVPDSTMMPNCALLPGSTVPMVLTVANLGNAMARNVTVSLSCPSADITLAPTNVTIDSIAVGSTAVCYINATVAASATDGTAIAVTCSTAWNGCSQPTVNQLHLTVTAPLIEIVYSDNNALLPGATATIDVTLTNRGHAMLTAASLTFTSPTSLFTLTPQASGPVTLAPGASVQRQYTMHAGTQLPLGIEVPLALTLANSVITVTDTQPIYLGNATHETFEGGAYHLIGWNAPAAYPWAISNEQPYQGSYCLRSVQYTSHSMTSDMNLSITVDAPDSISFYYRVSSEQSYDKFHFMIDNESLFNTSGDVDWTRAAFLISAGTHTVTFRYAKDGSVNSGSDAAWIDNIVLPHTTRQAVFQTDNLCVGDSYTIGGQTINTDTPQNGTAVLDGNPVTVVDYTINPVYTVSQTMTACDSLVWNDSLYTTDFHYNLPMTSMYGCDSSVHINITIGHTVYDTFEVVTQANNYHWNGQTYTESGDYQQLFTSAIGCDSIVTLHITFNDPNDGIDGVQQVQLSLWPTPTTGMVHLDRTVDRIEVYDIRGRLVATRTDADGIDLTGMPSGIYLLRMPTLGATARISLLSND